MVSTSNSVPASLPVLGDLSENENNLTDHFDKFDANITRKRTYVASTGFDDDEDVY